MHQTLTVNWLLDATGGNGRTKATRVKYDVLATIGIRKKHKLDLDRLLQPGIRIIKLWLKLKQNSFDSFDFLGAFTTAR